MILVDAPEVLNLGVASISCFLEGVPALEVVAVLALDDHILLSDSPFIEITSGVGVESAHLLKKACLKVFLGVKHLLASIIHESDLCLISELSVIFLPVIRIKTVIKIRK